MVLTASSCISSAQKEHFLVDMDLLASNLGLSLTGKSLWLDRCLNTRLTVALRLLRSSGLCRV